MYPRSGFWYRRSVFLYPRSGCWYPHSFFYPRSGFGGQETSRDSPAVPVKGRERIIN